MTLSHCLILILSSRNSLLCKIYAYLHVQLTLFYPMSQTKPQEWHYAMAEWQPGGRPDRFGLMKNKFDSYQSMDYERFTVLPVDALHFLPQKSSLTFLKWPIQQLIW